MRIRQVVSYAIVLIALAGATWPIPAVAQSGWSNSGITGTCSSQSATRPCSMMFDGLFTSSNWGQNEFDTWPLTINLDLGSAKQISGVRRYQGGTSSSYIGNYTVYGCADVSFVGCGTPIGTFNTPNGSAGSWYEWRFVEETFRYWRVVIPNNATNHVRLGELQLYHGVCDTCSTPTATATNTPVPATATNTPVPATATNTPIPPTPTPTATGLAPDDTIPFEDVVNYPDEWFVCSRWADMTVHVCRELDWIHGESRSTAFGWNVDGNAGEGVVDKQVELYVVPPSETWDGQAMVVEAMEFSCIGSLREIPFGSLETGGWIGLFPNNTNVTMTILGGSSNITSEGHKDFGKYAFFNDPTASWYDGIPVTAFPGMIVRVYSNLLGHYSTAHFQCNVDSADGMIDNPNITPGPTSIPTATADQSTVTPSPTLSPTPTLGATPTVTGTPVWRQTVVPVLPGTPWSPGGGLPIPTVWNPSVPMTTPVVWDPSVPIAAPTVWDPSAPIVVPTVWDPSAPLATPVAYVPGTPFVPADPLLPLPTRDWDVGISDPDTNCAFSMPAVGPYGGTPIVGIPIPLIDFPEVNICTEEYDFEFQFLGWDLGVLLTAIVVSLGFGLIWSIIKR